MGFWIERGPISFAVLVAASLMCGAAHARHHSHTQYHSDIVDEGAADEARRAVSEHSFALRPVMFELRTGGATIVGLFGATASFDPWSRLSLGGGFGVNSAGVQVAGFARLRPLVFMGHRRARLHAVGVELGYSTGAYQDYTLDSLYGIGSYLTYRYDRVHWLQPQLTYETRSYRGFNVLGGVGVALPVAKQGYHCLDQSYCGQTHISVLPTFTLGVGWAMLL
ncbi:MAG TPA: hypothetical protein VER96_38455 [Polyangiaceae bacterium]|nr:hypothetical protein [Polyangiaceae bacterium]